MSVAAAGDAGQDLLELPAGLQQGGTQHLDDGGDVHEPRRDAAKDSKDVGDGQVAGIKPNAEAAEAAERGSRG